MLGLDFTRDKFGMFFTYGLRLFIHIEFTPDHIFICFKKSNNSKAIIRTFVETTKLNN